MREKKVTGRRSLWQSATVITLTMVMLLLPYVSGFAGDPIDLTRTNTLIVEPSGGQADAEDFSDDIGKADTVIDLYQVAKADKVDGYDTYQFVQGNPAFADLLESIRNKDNTAEQWRTIANSAAETAKAGGDIIKYNKDPFPLESQITGLEPGLYLVIARSASDPDYWDTNDEGQVITKSRSDEWIYSFLPELVAFPTKAAEDGVIATGNTGDWLYETTIKMKAERTPAKSNLKIIKNLPTYESKDPAKFVFMVEATFKGRTVYSNVHTITFDAKTGPGQQSVVVEDLLVGSKVKVTEMYSGNVYDVTTDKSVTVTIPAEKDVAQAEFTNDYEDEYKGGGSINNEFNYNNNLVDGSDNSAVGWELEQKKDK